MNQPIVQSKTGVTLVGGGPVSAALLRQARAMAPRLVAADSGADRLIRLGQRPEAVIGDLDSISAAARRLLPAAALHHIAEQETTDFDKALRSVVAPFVLAIGFAGARMDHGLAVLNCLVRQGGDRPCLLLGPQDIVFAAPPRPVRLDLRRGDRLSLFPMAEVGGRSEGLEWPIDGIDFAPAGRIGTSNRVTRGPVLLDFARPGMLVILPRARLAAAMRGLGAPVPDAAVPTAVPGG